MPGAWSLVLGALVLGAAAPGTHTQAPGTRHPALVSLPIPGTSAELAEAAGVHRVDASTLPLDIVRIAFSSPDGPEESRVRAAIARVLQRDVPSAARLPLPLSAQTWRAKVLGGRVAEGRLAHAIFSSRSAALLYYGLMGVDPATLAWIESHPALLETLYRHPGVTAVYARSLRIRNDRVVTPGDGADDVWAATVGASPRTPDAFVAKLWSARAGRLAGLYDTVAHLDPPHQAFAIGTPGDTDRVERARNLLDAITTLEPQWRLADHPFRRPDVDAGVLLRTVRVSAAGQLAPPASRPVWSRVFGGVAERGPIDAAWLARRILEGGDSLARQRLDVFLFAQRALGATAAQDDEALVEALSGFARYPALMLTLEGHGLDARMFAAAIRSAAALAGRETVAIFQSGLAILDRARRSGSIGSAQSRAAIASLLDAARAPDAPEGLLAWVRDGLLATLSRAPAGREARDADALLISAMAGPRSSNERPIEWEGQRYRADLAAAERQRIASLRGIQDEPRIERALSSATARDLGPLAQSMMALVYADALGEPDGQPAAAGPVWRRHRFEGSYGGDLSRPIAWRLAAEVFAEGGWHLAGSILRLDLALAHLSLRRLDATEMPMPSVLPASSRRTLALSVAVIDPRALGDEDRDAIAEALSRGRARTAALVKDSPEFDRLAADAGLSEWRSNAARWALEADRPGAVPAALTLLELYRLGGGQARASWGTAAVPLDGCFCPGFPGPAAWEEFAGRPASGQMATQLADVMLRTAAALAARKLPAILARDVAAFAMQETIDRARPSHLDDWLPVAYAARDLTEAQFDDYIAALTAGGPLVPAGGSR